jgi:hypothetical protein
VTIHDCRVTYAEPAEKVSQIIEEASGSVWCKPTIKTTAINLNVQAARLGVPVTQINDRAASVLDLTDQPVGGLVRS